ncbi:putative Centromere protein J [Cardiosporidium cionae]|uniref:Centromere protein J n=1 Tax=Cardiosporidium cionae TaxID=476202 RepID=A0ABQ7JC89_9APIC|nr:putative Centromere protein J [Cardiosporidium cionae]|eukprot:KAF8821615.1 putative Centromere protein J [Cardiosporidium cionae]
MTILHFPCHSSGYFDMHTKCMLLPNSIECHVFKSFDVNKETLQDLYKYVGKNLASSQLSTNSLKGSQVAQESLADNDDLQLMHSMDFGSSRMSISMEGGAITPMKENAWTDNTGIEFKNRATPVSTEQRMPHFEDSGGGKASKDVVGSRESATMDQRVDALQNIKLEGLSVDRITFEAQKKKYFESLLDNAMAVEAASFQRASVSADIPSLDTNPALDRKTFDGKFPFLKKGAGKNASNPQTPKKPLIQPEGGGNVYPSGKATATPNSDTPSHTKAEDGMIFQNPSRTLQLDIRTAPDNHTVMEPPLNDPSRSEDDDDILLRATPREGYSQESPEAASVSLHPLTAPSNRQTPLLTPISKGSSLSRIIAGTPASHTMASLAGPGHPLNDDAPLIHTTMRYPPRGTYSDDAFSTDSFGDRKPWEGGQEGAELLSPLEALWDFPRCDSLKDGKPQPGEETAALGAPISSLVRQHFYPNSNKNHRNRKTMALLKPPPQLEFREPFPSSRSQDKRLAVAAVRQGRGTEALSAVGSYRMEMEEVGTEKLGKEIDLILKTKLKSVELQLIRLQKAEKLLKHRHQELNTIFAELDLERETLRNDIEEERYTMLQDMEVEKKRMIKEKKRLEGEQERYRKTLTTQNRQTEEINKLKQRIEELEEDLRARDTRQKVELGRMRRQNEVLAQENYDLKESYRMLEEGSILRREESGLAVAENFTHWIYPELSDLRGRPSLSSPSGGAVFPRTERALSSPANRVKAKDSLNRTEKPSKGVASSKEKDDGKRRAHSRMRRSSTYEADSEASGSIRKNEQKKLQVAAATFGSDVSQDGEESLNPSASRPLVSKTHLDRLKLRPAKQKVTTHRKEMSDRSAPVPASPKPLNRQKVRLPSQELHSGLKKHSNIERPPRKHSHCPPPLSCDSSHSSEQFGMNGSITPSEWEDQAEEAAASIQLQSSHASEEFADPPEVSSQFFQELEDEDARCTSLTATQNRMDGLSVSHNPDVERESKQRLDAPFQSISEIPFNSPNKKGGIQEKSPNAVLGGLLNDSFGIQALPIDPNLSMTGTNTRVMGYAPSSLTNSHNSAYPKAAVGNMTLRNSSPFLSRNSYEKSLLGDKMNAGGYEGLSAFKEGKPFASSSKFDELQGVRGRDAFSTVQPIIPEFPSFPDTHKLDDSSSWENLIKFDFVKIFDLSNHTLQEVISRLSSIKSQIVTANNLKETIYSSGDQETLHPTGLRKIESTEGWLFVFFPNKDMKIVMPDKTQLYRFFQEETLQVTLCNGTIYNRFSSGQIECLELDGSLRVVFPNGIRKILKNS